MSYSYCPEVLTEVITFHPEPPFHVSGDCFKRSTAWQYRPLSRLARHRRVRLRIHKRRGLFFILRPLLRRSGLWLGAAIFIPLVFWSQGLVWSVHYGSLTAGQQARAQVLLRQSGLIPGALVNEEKLAAGEYALVQSGEFSWASLKFGARRRQGWPSTSE